MLVDRGDIGGDPPTAYLSTYQSRQNLGLAAAGNNYTVDSSQVAVYQAHHNVIKTQKYCPRIICLNRSMLPL